MIENLEKIKSPELRDNLIRIRTELLNLIIQEVNSDFHILKPQIEKFLYKWVIGISFPISICDYLCTIHSQNIGNLAKDDAYIEIRLLVDYAVASGYKPYQDLDKIELHFSLSKEDIRDSKLDSILSD